PYRADRYDRGPPAGRRGPTAPGHHRAAGPARFEPCQLSPNGQERPLRQRDVPLGRDRPRRQTGLTDLTPAPSPARRERGLTVSRLRASTPERHSSPLQDDLRTSD